MPLRIVRRALGLGVLLAAGCGGPEMAAVEGKVSFNGKPVKEAQVTFAPVPTSADIKEPGKAATGFTDEAGRFSLSTFQPHDGAIVGKHRVLVVIDATNPAKAKLENKYELEVKPTKNELNIDLQGR